MSTPSFAPEPSVALQQDRTSPGDAACGAWGDRWLDALCAILLGYALFGRGFAYLGLPPMFVGELVMLLGILWLIGSGRWKVVLAARTLWPLFALAAWGMICTLPYINRYGTTALRDAALWSYSAYAVVLYGCLLDRPERLGALWSRYQRFAVIFVPIIIGVWLLHPRLEAVIPRWPWSDGVPMIDVKGGDVMVHLAGVLASMVVVSGRVAGVGRVMLLMTAVGLVGVHSRAGLVSFAGALAVCAFCQPLNRNLWKMFVIGYCALSMFAVSGLRIKAAPQIEKGREISFQQLQDNVASIFGSTDKGDLDNTKNWRLNWWGKIVDYTVFGQYFWTGKGFGINLADDDGFQGTAWEGKLRSPHNGHLTMLARSGVPGAMLWASVHLFWLLRVWRYFRHSRSLGQRNWSGIFLFLLAFWTAFMANAAFDVFLEGPMGGIWFWSLFGTGLAAVRIYQRQLEQVDMPDQLSDSIPSPRPAGT